MLETFSVTIPSLSGDTPRRAYVYVPDSILTEPDMRYPVLYMFDGHNVFYDEDATYGKSWGMGEYMDATQTQMMIAAVECNHGPDNARLVEYCPFTGEMYGFGTIKGRGKATMDWFVDEFKPLIDAHYPTIPNREFTFIAGSSMGGLMSLYAVTKYNRVFSRCAALSPSLWFAQDKLDGLFRASRMRRDTHIYMDYGSEELKNHAGMAEGFAKVTGILMARRLYVTSRIVPGGEHTEGSWEKQIPIFMEALLYGLEEWR